MPQLFIDSGDVGVGYLTALALGVGGSWVCQPVSFPSLPPPELTLQQHHLLPALSYVADSKEWGHFFCSHALRSSSPIRTPPEPSVLLRSGDVMDALRLLPFSKRQAQPFCSHAPEVICPICHRWQGVEGILPSYDMQGRG